jgi:hypothetical protein
MSVIEGMRTDARSGPARRRPTGRLRVALCLAAMLVIGCDSTTPSPAPTGANPPPGPTSTPGASTQSPSPTTTASVAAGRVPGVTSVLAASILLPDGRVFAFGGTVDSFLAVGSTAGAIFDPATGTWTATAPSPEGVIAPQLRTLPDGRIGVVGTGHNSRNAPEIVGLVYDPTADAWSSAASLEPFAIGLQIGVARVIAAFGDDRMVIVGRFGKAAVWSRDGRWKTIAAPFDALEGISAIPLPGGRVLAVGAGTVGSELTGRAWILDPATPTWTETAKPPLALRAAVGVPIDGSVLVAGSPVNTSSIAAAMRFDPLAVTWRAAAAPSVARVGATLTALQAGGALLLGGSPVTSGCAPLLGGERYDASTDAWTPVGHLSVPRAEHVASLLPDGRLLVALGTTGSGQRDCIVSSHATDTAEVLDPAALVTVTLPAPAAPAGAAALPPPSQVRLADLKQAADCAVPTTCLAPRVFAPYATGGGVLAVPLRPGLLSIAPDGTPASFAAPRDGADRGDGAALLADGSVLLIGLGNSSSPPRPAAARFDPLTGKVTPVTAPGPYRSISGMVALPDGRILLVGEPRATAPAGPDATGAASSADPGSSALPDADAARMTAAYDPATDAWTALGPAPASLHGAAIATLKDGRVAMVGGDGPQPLGDAWLFDPTSAAWTPIAPMPGPRTRAVVRLLNDGRLFVVGGVDGDGPRPDAIVYDPAANAWSPAGALPAPRDRFAIAQARDGRVVIAGGSAVDGSSDVLQTTLIFDPAAGTWSTGPDLTRARSGAAALVLADGRMAIVGGVAAPGASTAAILSMDLIGPFGS